MIDLHCHLHFACDDGPRTISQSVAMAQALVKEGVSKVACTPHIRSDKGWINSAKEQDLLMRRTQKALDEHEIDLTVKGAEHYIDETLFAQPFEEYVVPYGDTRWLLLELPYHGEPLGLFDLLFRFRQAGYQVLLAHLERFPYVCEHPGKIERFLDSGILLQVNLGSLAGSYGRAYKKAAKKLIKNGYVSVLSSDCHTAEDVNRYLIKGRKVLEKLVTPQACQRLLIDNPNAILSGEEAYRIWP